MKKNHFFFGWAGNKRCEADKIDDYIQPKLDNITTIVEPFCGSCAFSVFLSIKYPKKYKYVINDVDKNLIELFHLAKDTVRLKDFTEKLNEEVKNITNKENYNEIVKREGLLYWFIKNRIYAIRAGLYNPKYKPQTYDFSLLPIVQFLQNEDVEIFNKDGIEICEDYRDNKEAVLFIDPPYLMACNDYYDKSRNINIYEYCYLNSIGLWDCFCVFVLEKNWMVHLLFKDFIKLEYQKLYQPKKKQTIHVLISNK